MRITNFFLIPLLLSLGFFNPTFSQVHSSIQCKDLTPLSTFSKFQKSTIDAICQKSNTRELNADLLLALTLAAEDKANARSLHTKYKEKLDSFAQSRDWSGTSRKDAKAFYSAFYKNFIGTTNQTKASRKYDFYQNELSVLLETQEFNCSTTSLLLALAADKSGVYQANAVILPHHVYTELYLSDHTKIDVETTTPNGFDVQRGKGYYQEKTPDYFRSKNYPTPTDEDFKKRKSIPTFHLIRDALLLEYTSPDTASTNKKKPGETPKRKLRQLEMCLMLGGECHELLMIEYYNMVFELYETKSYQKLDRIFQSIWPFVQYFAKTYKERSLPDNLVLQGQEKLDELVHFMLFTYFSQQTRGGKIATATQKELAPFYAVQEHKEWISKLIYNALLERLSQNPKSDAKFMQPYVQYLSEKQKVNLTGTLRQTQVNALAENKQWKAAYGLLMNAKKESLPNDVKSYFKEITPGVQLNYALEELKTGNTRLADKLTQNCSTFPKQSKKTCNEIQAQIQRMRLSKDLNSALKKNDCKSALQVIPKLMPYVLTEKDRQQLKDLEKGCLQQ